MKPILARISSLNIFKLLFVCGLLLTLSSCLKQERNVQLDSAPVAAQFVDNAPHQVNINYASREELEKLPGIGPGLAARIVEHRERNGGFRRAEHLIMVRGLSHRRFMAMRAFVTVE
jgi:competence ComEA-like helix-hairpin-helix protein